jgi:hypothetical protein
MFTGIAFLSGAALLGVGLIRCLPGPDRDLRGLNFWRDSLDRWGDYRSISRAFLESNEYKKSRPPP